jgi:hypothetical protein
MNGGGKRMKIQEKENRDMPKKVLLIVKGLMSLNSRTYRIVVRMVTVLLTIAMGILFLKGGR